MPMTRTIIHKNIASAEAKLKDRETFLETKKLDKKATRQDPFLRHIQSDIRALKRRLQSLEKTETLNQETKARKSAQ